MDYGEVRIIGGQWRSRKLKFPAIAGLRPTPDRVRETLFNWLSPFIHDARCLDLFAGSGALGFEALSRGAAFVAFVDQDPQIVRYLHTQLRLFGTSSAKTYCTQVPSPTVFKDFLLGSPFNLVFLDPPFKKDLLSSCCTWLEQQLWLAPQALIYLEAEASLTPLPIPENWHIIRSKTTGQVGYHLIQRNADLAT